MRGLMASTCEKRNAVLIDMTAWVTAKIKLFFLFIYLFKNHWCVELKIFFYASFVDAICFFSTGGSRG